MELTIEFSHQSNIFRVTFIYAGVLPNKRRQLLDYLNRVGPWLVLGDFNADLGAHEKMGGALPNVRSCKDFSLMMQDCNS